MLQNSMKKSLVCAGGMTLLLVAGCTTKTVDPWSEWRESSRAQVSLQPEEGYPVEIRALGIEENWKTSERPKPILVSELAVQCIVEEDVRFRRSRTHTTKKHIPLVGKPSTGNIISFYLDIAVNIVTYPLRWKSYEYNSTDYDNENEEKIERETDVRWISAGDLPVEERPYVNLPDLKKNAAQSYNSMRWNLSSYEEDLLQLSALNVEIRRLLSEDQWAVVATNTVELKAYQQAMTAYRKHQEQLAVAEAERKAERSRKIAGWISHAREEQEAISRFEENGEYKKALDAVSDLLRFLNRDTGYDFEMATLIYEETGITESELKARRLELAGLAGDLDLLMKLQSE
ncbi:hypothetical protein [Pontiella agarivorans]|uniref:Lipoprotein n=1 Tax=Pontiella agarivorans TaxID=3038953 RepID=A0ABU5MXG3_9BACT|nr:hypothetical protein [Pontiella agarivorans]MDZ8118661.1 hypothetical protein [Pontiella agarivorans]